MPTLKTGAELKTFASRQFIGVAPLDGAEAGPAPAAFEAVTVKV